MLNQTKQATVLSFNRASGMGWAVPDDLTDDIFLHRLQIQGDRRYLNPDDRISYEMGEFNGRPCATNIRFIGCTVAKQINADRVRTNGGRS